MARITAVLNQKGGVGKTATAHALATGLTHRGKKTLVVDADAQSNLSYIMQADPAHVGLYEAMRGTVTGADAIQHTAQGDIIGSSIDLAGADMEFTRTGREYLLRETLTEIKPRYDYIILDCAPSLGIMTVNALTAADDIVIPLPPEILALQGLRQLLSTVSAVQRYSNPALEIAGILITRRGSRATVTRELVEAIRQRAGGLQLHLYDTAIREAVAVRECQVLRSSIFDACPGAKVTEDYSNFIDEYVMQGGK